MKKKKFYAVPFIPEFWPGSPFASAPWEFASLTPPLLYAFELNIAVWSYIYSFINLLKLMVHDFILPYVLVMYFFSLNSLKYFIWHSCLRQKSYQIKILKNILYMYEDGDFFTIKMFWSSKFLWKIFKFKTFLRRTFFFV